jgi:hypothetical protein
MSTAALSRARAEIETLRARAAGARAKASRSAGMLQRDATTVAGAYAYGAMRKAGTLPATILGMDSDTAVVAGLYLLSHFSSGTVSHVAHDVAMGVASALAYHKGNS